jgi:hypothetical protein
MLATSSVVTGLLKLSSVSVRTTAIRNRLNPISRPADNPEMNRTLTGRCRASAPSAISASRISRDGFLGSAASGTGC